MTGRHAFEIRQAVNIELEKPWCFSVPDAVPGPMVLEAVNGITYHLEREEWGWSVYLLDGRIPAGHWWRPTVDSANRLAQKKMRRYTAWRRRMISRQWRKNHGVQA